MKNQKKYEMQSARLAPFTPHSIKRDYHPRSAFHDTRLRFLRRYLNFALLGNRLFARDQFGLIPCTQCSLSKTLMEMVPAFTHVTLVAPDFNLRACRQRS